MIENKRKGPGKWQMRSRLRNVTTAERKPPGFYGITGGRQISGLSYSVHAPACNKKPQEQ
jgi:hypothetical protein